MVAQFQISTIVRSLIGHRNARHDAGKIDFHFHAIPPFYCDAVYAAGTEPAIGRYPEWTPGIGGRDHGQARHRDGDDVGCAARRGVPGGRYGDRVVGQFDYGEA
jgi:hypothetical protein